MNCGSCSQISSSCNCPITKDIKKIACTHLRKYAKLQYCAQHSLSFFSLAFSSRTVFCTSFFGTIYDPFLYSNHFSVSFITITITTSIITKLTFMYYSTDNIIWWYNSHLKVPKSWLFFLARKHYPLFVYTLIRKCVIILSLLHSLMQSLLGAVYLIPEWLS